MPWPGCQQHWEDAGSHTTHGMSPFGTQTNQEPPWMDTARGSPLWSCPQETQGLSSILQPDKSNQGKSLSHSHQEMRAVQNRAGASNKPLLAQGLLLTCTVCGREGREEGSPAPRRALPTVAPAQQLGTNCWCHHRGASTKQEPGVKWEVARTQPHPCEGRDSPQRAPLMDPDKPGTAPPAAEPRPIDSFYRLQTSLTRI